VISAPVVLRMRSGPVKVPPTTEGGREMTEKEDLWRRAGHYGIDSHYGKDVAWDMEHGH